jgi:hypothetical protein
MAPRPHAMQLTDRADWALMIAIHDALRRDLDQLLHATASHASARARWGTFRRQLRFYLTPACPKANGCNHSYATRWSRRSTPSAWRAWPASANPPQPPAAP